ncbi:hypothetical protein QM012_005312 [Aureobasidium pullulans]|uniref:Diacylglycerol O-acyltransferase n=1 Tax=Aureobasidium pullulans TaxID=5580 RepID=A0ABR0T5E8_AURPU
MAAAEGRSLDLLERFQLAQARAGSVPCITIIGLMAVTSDKLGLILERIGHNIDRLLRTHPVLVSSIDNTDIRRPRWLLNNGYRPFAAEEIIEPQFVEVGSIAQMAEAEDAEAQAFSLTDGPLWRIGFYYLKHQPFDAYVALTIHHVITDGMGALGLFEEVMRQPFGVPTTSSQPRPQPMPPKAQKTIRVKPSVIGIVRKGARWILNHRLSSKVTHGLGATTKWPPTNLLKDNPRRPDVSYISVDFSKDQNRIVERLEALGHQIGTVHSVLHTAAVVALAAAFSSGNELHTFDTIGTETPMSLRSQRHPRIGGNYIGLVERSIPISKLRSETIASFTKDMNDYIHSREARSDARSRVGEFRLLPDRLIPDLWKARLIKRATADNPFRNSLRVSNLGRFEPTRIPGLQKVWFCHASMPWDAAINMDVVSLNLTQPSDVSGRREARLAVMISWIDGAIGRDLINRFCAALIKVVNLLAKAGGAPNLDRHAMRGRHLQDLVN